MDHRTIVFALGLVAAFCMTGNALGHLVVRERELVVVVGPDDVSVRARLSIHAGPEAARLRAAADLNGDGMVQNGAERDALSARLRSLATSELSLQLNQRVLALAVDQHRLLLSGGALVEPGGGIQFELVLLARGVLGPGRHELRIEDGPPAGRGVVAVQLRLGPGVSLVGQRSGGAAVALGAPVDDLRHGGFGSGGGSLTLDLVCVRTESRPRPSD